MKEFPSTVFAILLGFGFAGLSGCASPEAKVRASTDDQFFWKRSNPYPPQIGASAEVLNKEANNSKTERVSRCVDAFVLFRAYIRPGSSSKQIGAVLRGATWLDEVRLDPVGALGGWVPVFAGRSDTIFVLYAFPDGRGVSDWIIYFVLSSFEARYEEDLREKALEFLRGTLREKGVRLREFALCYPWCKIERFTRSGVGLMVTDEGYRVESDDQ